VIEELVYSVYTAELILFKKNNSPSSGNDREDLLYIYVFSNIFLWFFVYANQEIDLFCQRRPRIDFTVQI
jgi:hypothetical protein